MSSRICWQSMALRYASSDGTRLPGTCTRLGAKAISISNRKLQDCHEYNVARFFSTHNRDYVPKAGCPFVLPKRVCFGTKSCVPTTSTATKRQQGLASVFNTRLWLRKHTWKQHRRAARNAGPTISTCCRKKSFRNQSLHDPSFSSEYLPAPGVCRASCAATGVLWGVTEKSAISNCTCKQQPQKTHPPLAMFGDDPHLRWTAGKTRPWSWPKLWEFRHLRDFHNHSAAFWSFPVEVSPPVHKKKNTVRTCRIWDQFCVKF